jgi:cobalt-zinc-cadmium efflux system outer membrane protein
MVPDGPNFARPALVHNLLESSSRRRVLPDYGQLVIPARGTPVGDAGGLTLEQTIAIMLNHNHDLKAKFFDLSQADAHILTAGLRANPLFFADTQGVPYGSYTVQRPGNLQYDVNITHPLDLSHKRRQRVDSATRTREVLGVLYQDAARKKIDETSQAFVDALAGRLKVQIACVNLRGAQELLDWSRKKSSGSSPISQRRFCIQREKAKLALDKEQDRVDDQNDALATLLGEPPDAGKTLRIDGVLRLDRPRVPSSDELTTLARSHRPDLQAFRMGVGLAESGVRLALANRFEDVFLLYQPYTFHAGFPNDQQGSYAWALGVTVPLPLYNRNQGNIARARSNVDQTKVQLEAAEHQVALEVRQAFEEHEGAWDALHYFETHLLKEAETLFNDIKADYVGSPSGQRPKDPVYFDARADYNETAVQFIEALLRYRRSLIALNSAVGCRIVP